MIDIHRIGSLTLETEFSQTPYLLSDMLLDKKRLNKSNQTPTILGLLGCVTSS